MAVIKYWDGLQWVKMPLIVPSSVMSVNGKTGVIVLQENDIPNLVDDLDSKVVKPAVEGEDGQFLISKGDGSTQWKTFEVSEPTFVAPKYEKSQTYPAGSYVFYDNDLYKAKDFVPTASEFDPSKWEKTKVMNELLDQEVDLHSIAPDFDKTNAYAKGDYVIFASGLYQAKENIPAGEFNPVKWESKSVTNLNDEVDNRVDAAEEMLADEYSTTATYSEGDYVVYEDKLYKANNTTSGAFDTSKWDEVKITDELDNNINNVCSEWSNAKLYKCSDMVIYEDKLYVLTAASSTVGTWKPSEWHEIKAVDQLVSMLNQLIKALGVKAVPTWDGSNISYNFELDE